MIRTQVSLDARTYEEARREASRQGISFAELCRRALRQVLRRPAREERPWMRFAGAVKADVPDASASVDEVVYGRERP
ncbi:MAG TPA: CopG family transcriptional regulator [Thermoanaerobaculia bacterium]|jgi:hypothetical protein